MKNNKIKDDAVTWREAIPKDWKIVPLSKYFVSKVDYRGKTPEKIASSNYFLITTRNIKEGIINYLESVEYITKKAFEDSRLRGIPKIGDIVFTMEAPLGEVAVVDREDVAFGQRIIKFRLNEELFLPQFTIYSLKSHYFQFLCSTEATGSTALGLKSSKIHKLRFILPPIDIQTVITSFLNKKTAQISKFIDDKKKMIELLKEQKQAIIYNAVTKGIDKNTKMKNSDIAWLGQIPEGWEVRPLWTIGDFLFSGIDKKINEDEFMVKMVNYTDVYGNKLATITRDIELMEVSCPKNKLEICMLKKGDMIFTPSSETIEDIGISAVIVDEIENTVFSYHTIRFRSKKIDLGYKKYVCNNHFVLNQFSRECKGTTRKILGREEFRWALVLLPPLPTQKAIADYLDKKTAEIETAIAKIQKEISLIEEYKKSLIYHAVTGKINIEAVNDSIN